jgi:hypothetical protein
MLGLTKTQYSSITGEGVISEYLIEMILNGVISYIMFGLVFALFTFLTPSRRVLTMIDSMSYYTDRVNRFLGVED